MNDMQVDLPVWVTNPESVMKWIEANQVSIMIWSGVAVLVFFIACFVAGRLISDKTDKKKEFGKSVWADEKALRKKGHLSTDL